MSIWLFSLGVIILLLTAIDIVITTFAPTGSGMITGRLRRWIWSFFLWLTGNKGDNKLLNYAGPATVVIWLMGWLLLIWLGNALIFLSKPDSVIMAGNMSSTTWEEKFYFTGYTLSTLGSGEFIPHGTGWQLYSALISFSGFIFITIVLTYLYSVVTNDINRRKVSLKIYHIGSTPQEILLRFWNGQDFTSIQNDLSTLAEQILQVAQNHMAYPVMHNFHSTRREESLPLNLTALDEALTLLLLYKPKEVAPSLPELYDLRSAITFYLETLQNAFIKAADEDPPTPDLSPLLANKLPLHGKNYDTLREKNIKLRRRLLLGLLQSQGWTWQEVETNYNLDPLDQWLTTIRRQRLYAWPKPQQQKEDEKSEEISGS